ncbi:hypothetical protein [Bradyrhizobium jicamae]|uniref:hypothetical protein n=1 Tax=Bradyrhizobium jicamae TaxID=280332 RepID=UPI003D9B3B41
MAGARLVPFGLMAAVTLGMGIWPATSQAYTPEQQQACTPDAFRLCSSDIPDVDRITACMIRNKAQLSPACRAFFRGGPEPREVRAAQPPRPVAAAHRAPKATAKARKPAKPKKPVKPT